MKQIFKNKSILIIGGTGTIGRELLIELLKYDLKVVRVYSRDEYKQFMLQNELGQHKNIRYLIGDVRDKDRLSKAMQGIDIVFNLAALKHVPSSEYNPFEVVKTNVIGVQNTIEASIENKVKKVIYTSSDKAVSPTNTMGATKLLAERLISSADYSKGGNAPIFAAVRFGNVMGSRGSVIPLWQEQIRTKGDITVTDPDMTRFMMNTPQAVNLVLKACEVSKGGEVFVLKMPVIKLGDLAEVVTENECKKIGKAVEEVKIKSIGLRPGEKMYEELMTEHESVYALEHDNMFAIIPHHKIGKIDNYGVKRAKLGEYSSQLEQPLSKVGIVEMLTEAKII